MSRTLPEEAVKILRQYLLDHFEHPYPSGSEISKLSSLTHLPSSSVNNWFTNARRRMIKPLLKRIQEEEEEECCKIIDDCSQPNNLLSSKKVKERFVKEYFQSSKRKKRKTNPHHHEEEEESSHHHLKEEEENASHQEGQEPIVKEEDSPIKKRKTSLPYTSSTPSLTSIMEDSNSSQEEDMEINWIASLLLQLRKDIPIDQNC
ncbi:hypothetical protein ABK040_014253 [Willaertia magna]